MTVEQHELLDFEVAMIAKRAPDISVHHPGFCVNTRLAILSLISVEATPPDQASAYRTLLYRAYWQDGRDISDILVLQDLLASLNIHQINTLPQRSWQTVWKLGDFDQRIPAIESADGRIMLGLQHPFNIANYLSNGSQTTVDTGEYCDPQRRLKIATASLPKLSDALRLEVTSLTVGDFESIDQLLECNNPTPHDAVLIDYDSDQRDGHRAIRAIKEAITGLPDTPLIYIATTPYTDQEARAFNLGASDYVAQPQQLSPLIARINARIALSQSVTMLRQHAAIDGLTGLFNKREFERQLEREWRNACRNRTELSVVMVDIDYFKAYNDHYGHCAGDDCLRSVAAAVQGGILRPTDIAARFGGEEFVLLMPGTKQKGAIAVAERIQLTIEQLAIDHVKNPDIPQVTASFGVCATLPHADQTPLQFIELADQALYESKENGRNQISVRALEQPGYA